VDIAYKKDTVRLSIHKLNLYFLNLLKYKKNIYIKKIKSHLNYNKSYKFQVNSINNLNLTK